MHIEAYRQRADIRAVLHAHPIYATSLTIAGLPFPMDIIPEAAIGLGSVPVAEYATPGSRELAESIQWPIKQSKNIILSHHGTLTAGNTLEEALIALERIEHTAHSYFVAKSFGGIVPLSEQELGKLQIIGRKVRGEA
jgi:L-fuculose-phosphate aldolase